jgi:hypothetical protein
MTTKATCKLCGHPMPEGEEMFHYHGYSSKCPEPPLKKMQLDPAGAPKLEMTILEAQAVMLLNELKAAADGDLIQLPVEMRVKIDALLMMATVRRVGVQ